MKRNFADWPCSVARATQLLGDHWVPLIMRDAVQGVRRFDDFQRSLGVARNILSDRLDRLVEGGLLERKSYQDRPPRSEYVLTEMGRDLFPVLASLAAWGDRWLDGGSGAPVALHDETRGHDMRASVVCAECGEPIRLADVEFRVGPGYPDEVDAHYDLRPRLAPSPQK